MNSFEQIKNDGLTRRQLRALPALVESPTVEAASKQCGISASTLRRWLTTSEDFRAAVIKAQNQILEETFRRLASKSYLAAEALEKGIQSTDERLACRVALGWLALGRKSRQDVKLEELERAIEHLKSVLAEKEKKENA